jgi:RNA polymerase sigma factor (sigma-70 family)
MAPVAPCSTSNSASLPVGERRAAARQGRGTGVTFRLAMSIPHEPKAPHLEPTSWSRLVDSLDAAPIFVVIGGWLGPDARMHVSVEDIWQETLWMAWRDRQQHEWAGLTKYRAWLLAIAHNRIREVVRNMGRKRRTGSSPTARFSDLGGSDTVDGYLPPRSTTPSRTATNLERARVLEQALATLPDATRDVVRLRMFEELTVVAAAAQLGMPVGTFKDRLVRGLATYRAELVRRLGPDQGWDQGSAQEPR